MNTDGASISKTIGRVGSGFKLGFEVVEGSRGDQSVTYYEWAASTYPESEIAGKIAEEWKDGLEDWERLHHEGFHFVFHGRSVTREVVILQCNDMKMHLQLLRFKAANADTFCFCCCFSTQNKTHFDKAHCKCRGHKHTLPSSEHEAPDTACPTFYPPINEKRKEKKVSHCLHGVC